MILQILGVSRSMLIVVHHLALRMLVTGAASLAVAQLSVSGEEAGGRWAAS